MSYVIDIRRQLHQYPEIGFELPKTLALVRRELTAMGIPFTEKYGKSGIVATINEEKSSYTIGIRADMDALPITEKRKCPYKSKLKGQMHACGHDSHTAILLDTARQLAKMKDQINCRVKLIFQPAEEYTVPGGKLMVEDGVLNDVDCAVALHIDPTHNAGRIAVLPGPINAISNGFWLDFYGKSTHVAKQQFGVDAIAMAVKAYFAIELMIAKELAFDQVCIFNIGTFHAGETNNVICDHANMYGTIRTHDEATREFVIKRIKEIINHTAKSSHGKATYTQGKHLPVVLNDEEITAKIRAAAIKVVGEDNVISYTRQTGGEDFGFYTQVKPSCMFRLGVRNVEKDCVYAVHQDMFDLDEDVLHLGTETFVQFVLDNMNTKKE